MNLPLLRLRKGEERRLRAGHLWIFSNEVDVEKTPLKDFPPGAIACVENDRGQALGLAYVNPESLICARLLTRNPQESIDADFLARRLRQALALRQRLYPEPYYRLVYGESDGLPGLVVDRFGDVLSIQTSTAGMERLQALVLDVLESLLSPRTMVLRNDASSRELEGLPLIKEIIRGSLEDGLQLRENGALFQVDVLHGQKTGWFYDHRENRALAARLARGARVLDLFCYSGAWGIQAALAGALAVDAVDSSASALEQAQENARLNGVESLLHTVRSDAFEFLKQARETSRSYDLIILDPPALIKRKKDVKNGIEAYRRLNQMALQLLAPGGILVSASCSHHLHADTLHDLLRSTAQRGDKFLMILARGGQAPDHPIHPSIPETEYLKSLFCTMRC